MIKYNKQVAQRVIIFDPRIFYVKFSRF